MHQRRVAPAGATADYFRGKGLDYPPATGVDAMVTPGTPGGLMTMVAKWGLLSLADVLELVPVLGRESGGKASAILEN